MRATQKQLDKAAAELAISIGVDKYKALLTVATLAINEREDGIAQGIEYLREEVQKMTEQLTDAANDIEILIKEKEDLQIEVERAHAQIMEFNNVKQT